MKFTTEEFRFLQEAYEPFTKDYVPLPGDMVFFGTSQRDKGETDSYGIVISSDLESETANVMWTIPVELLVRVNANAAEQIREQIDADIMKDLLAIVEKKDG